MHVHLKPIDVALARVQGDTSTLRAIGRCPQCLAATQRVDEWMQLADHHDPLVAAEIEMGHLRLDTLTGLTLPQAIQLIRDDPEYHRWGLTRLVILSARRLCHRGAPPEQTWTAFRFVILGLELVPRLDPVLYGAVACLRIGLQVLETGLQLLSCLVDDTEYLDRARDLTFRRIYALLETMVTLE